MKATLERPRTQPLMEKRVFEGSQKEAIQHLQRKRFPRSYKVVISVNDEPGETEARKKSHLPTAIEAMRRDIERMGGFTEKESSQFKASSEDFRENPII